MSTELAAFESHAQIHEVAPASGSEMDDARALSSWLAFVESRNHLTFRAYKFEALRFRLFLETIHRGESARPEPFLLRDANETDVISYEAALLGSYRNRNLQAPVVVVPKDLMVKYGRTTQPFVSELDQGPVAQYRALGLKPSSVNQAITILHALYQHWMLPDPQTKRAYVMANPVRRIKGATNRVQRQTAKNFPPEAITAIMATLALQRSGLDPDKSQPQLQKLARRRWIVALFFGLWGRRQEIAQLRMNDFRHTGSRWTVHITRKGGKVQDLPVAPWVIQELSEYRRHLGLNPLPGSGDDMPAVPRLKRRSGKDAEPMAANTLYEEIIAVAKDAALLVRSGSVLQEKDPDDRELIATRLDDVTPHWFRHSGASMAINSGAMTLNNASKMLGHSSPTITAEMYHHPDDDEIERGMQEVGADHFAAKA